MLFETALATMFIPAWIVMLGSFALSMIITLYGIPSVVRISRIKNLYDIPGSRNSHLNPTPRLGGTMIYAGTIIPSIIFSGLTVPSELKYIIAGMTVLFFIGIKDDVVTLSPIKKAIGQFAAACLLVLPGDVLLDYFNFDTQSIFINSIFNVSFTLLIVMTLINSINFIDGIDGLASGVGIMVSMILGIWFYINADLSYAIICSALSGALYAFFYYNVFSKKYKIFLGDTGSMIIGFLLAVIIIHFLNVNYSADNSFSTVTYAPSLALALLFIPIFDTIRICIVRIKNRKSVFKADSNHVHHRVLRLSNTHLKATLSILFINVIIITLTYLFNDLGNRILIFLLIVLGVIFSLILGSE